MILKDIVANGEQRMIDLVRELVVKYIKGKCLILVALTIGGVVSEAHHPASILNDPFHISELRISLPHILRNLRIPKEIVP